MRYPSTHPQHEQALRQIEYELDVIEQLGFPGYFLLLVDIVEFCRRDDIYCQGRGSAANSAVCYALGVTKADAVALGLLFERFLSPERDGPPDIDLDIEHQRREEVIQYVYAKYGRDRAAQVANVITYRPRSRAARDGEGRRAAHPARPTRSRKWIDRSGATPARSTTLGEGGRAPVPALALDLAGQVLDFPRHLGIHSGGMVMADRPLVEFCPIEWARMEDRSVLQWDKDDCAAAGLVKFDLLGLGMLTMLHLAVDLVREHEGVEVDLATIPQEDEVYDLLCAADTIGVFQVESRAQMATLPRLRPAHASTTSWSRSRSSARARSRAARCTRTCGGATARSRSRTRTRSSRTCLEKTLGVPLFQEQLMQMAIDAAGFTPGEADQLRQAMGSKRSKARMAAMRDRLIDGMAERGITGETAEEIATQARGVRRLRLPREPLGELRLPRVLELVDQAALPGGVRVRAAQRAADGLLLAAHDRARRRASRGGGARPVRRTRRGATARSSRAPPTPGPVGHPQPGWHADPSIHAVRIGLRYVRGLADALLDRIDAERAARAVPRPRGLHPPHRRARRRARVARDRGRVRVLRRRPPRRRCGPRGARARATHDGVRTRCRASSPGIEAPPLPGMDRRWRRPRPTSGRPGSRPAGIPPSSCATGSPRAAWSPSRRCASCPHRSVVEVAGVVTHRQQPETANGVMFLNLEDETGLVNVICTARRVEALPQGRAHVTGAGGARPARAPPGRDQPAGAPHRAARPRRPPTLLRSRDFR